MTFKIIKMKKLALIIVLLCANLGFAQTKEDALTDAKITSEATLKEDYKTVFKYTLPSVIKLMGGEEAGLKILEDTFSQMKTQGFVFEKAEVIAVSDIVFEQDQHRCVVEGFNQMVMSNMRIKSKSYLLGIYNEDAKHWYFIEAKQIKNKALLDMILPNFETSLTIPEDDMTSEPITE